MTELWQADALIVITATFVLGGFVKGIVGLGLPTVVLGLLTAFLGLHSAMALMIVPSFATNLWQSVTGGALLPLLRRFWLLLLAVCAGTWVGTGVLARSDPAVFSGLLGVLLAVYAAFGLVTPPFAVPPKWERWLSPPLGAINGIFTGFTGTFVVPGVPYLQALGLSRDGLMQAMGILFTVSTVALAVALADNRLLSAELGTISLLGLVPAFVGMAAGRALRHRIPERQFRRVFFVALLALGIYVAARALS